VDLKSDIPFDLARAAHSGTSFVPEDRARQEQEDYARTLNGDFDVLFKLATTEEKRDTLLEEFERYRAGYRERFLAYLCSRSRCLSSMITGPSRFPTARNEKRNGVADRRSSDLIEFRERALKAIRRTLCPEEAPIMSGDADAVEWLQAKIIEAEAVQDRMVRVNAAWRKLVKDPATLDAQGLSSQDKELVRLFKPEHSWDKGPFAGFEITNNGANVRRMKERLEHLVQVKATPETVQEGTAARMEDCPPENRVRLFFPGKPDLKVRETLKHGGFRWAPSLGCWQGYRNQNTLELAMKTAGIS
jgi:hypothetical protein